LSILIGGLPKTNAGKPADWSRLPPNIGRAIHVAAAEDDRAPTRFARTGAGQRQVRWLKKPTAVGWGLPTNPMVIGGQVEGMIQWLTTLW